MNLDNDQQAAVDLMQGGANVFLTGNAGTGKSQTTLEFVGQSFRRVDVCATTGIAAINLQDSFRERAGVALKASTIYRFSGINLGPGPGDTHEEFFRKLAGGGRQFQNAARRIKSAECVLIDEISMLPGRVLSYLDFHFRRVRENNRPFGGVQIIAVGDFLQLPPVARNGKYDWAFLSPTWEGAGFLPAFLSRIHRQSDADFVHTLNDFREGRIRGKTAALLKARVAKFPPAEIPRLLTHNSMVNRWNSYQLECIEKPPKTFRAERKGSERDTDFLLKNIVTPEILELKEGARVMVTRNLPGKNGDLAAANGAVGNVVSMADSVITVKLDSGEEMPVERYDFKMDPTNADSAAVFQFPLRLAYAMTIHKSQGLTLDRALIDIRAAREPGQGYVALSRLRSLKGLLLKGYPKGVFVSDAAIRFYRSLEKAREVVA